MSVINRVLRDLDHKGAAPRVLAGVEAVPVHADHPRWPPLLAAAILMAAALAWWFWPHTPQSPARHAARPGLRMSDTLSEPTQKAATAPLPKIVISPQPHRVEAQARTPEVNRPAIGLDTHLPEPIRVSKAVLPPTPREQAQLAWEQASRLIEQGRGHDALAALESSLRLDPGHASARQALIALSLENNDPARAEALLRDGLQLHPNDGWYNRSLAQLSLQRGDTAQAIAVLKSGLGKEPDAEYWGLYAGILGKAGQAEAATRAYREAVRLGPEHGPWWIGLAVSLEQTGKPADAALAYQRALQTHLGPEVRDFAARKAAELGAPRGTPQGSPGDS